MRVLLLGGTSEIGLAILSALDLAPDAEVVLAGRDVPRMEVAGKTLPCRRVSVVPYDAADVARQARDADPGQVASWINELAEIGAHHPGVLRLVAILNATGDGT